MKTIPVQLKSKDYDILIGRGLRAQIGTEVAKVWSKRKIALVSDKNVAELYLKEVHQSLEDAGFDVLDLVVPAGESSKSLAQMGDLVQQMADAGFTRADGVLALGGGVVGDLAGFTAASYMRGIAFIQVATSLTAQVDSSVGGKTAVNLKEVKNIIGAFYQPDLVLVDPDFLDTLSDRDLVEGYGEVVKTSVLHGQDFFALTGKIKSVQDIREQAEELSIHSIRYKAKIVMADEKESGQRQFLNFGHTFGHAIELLSHGSLRHGEAVSIGMVMISQRFEAVGITEKGLTDEIAQRLAAVGLPIDSDLVGTPLFFKHIVNDKKNRGGILNLVAVKNVGEPVIVAKALDDMHDFV
ncbi:3-dehydroquinate synthase [Eupransor demetentiae]|uniref:3-dehydroquinate synthase n=1 Tax=Eupransor demetentiae TaxID=3109584 RepID=A0ABP0EPX2_9LACO|nr:3-dehydroquinate synthetase (AroB) [Lactobacillaceae bacterium LMG 33000]